VIANGHAFTLQIAASGDCRYIPKDGRSVYRHLHIVFMNYCDAFSSQQEFLSLVASRHSERDAGIAATQVLDNGWEVARLVQREIGK
jgi:hypothetical protein